MDMQAKHVDPEPIEVITSTNAIHLKSRTREYPEYLYVDPSCLALGWRNIPFGCSQFDKLVRCAHKHGGTWDGIRRVWQFDTLQDFHALIEKASAIGLKQCCSDTATKEFPTSADEFVRAYRRKLAHALPVVHQVHTPTGGLLFRQSPGSMDLTTTLRVAKVPFDDCVLAKVNGRSHTKCEPELLVVVPRDAVDAATGAIESGGYRCLSDPDPVLPPLQVEAERDRWLIRVYLPVQSHPWLAVLCGDHADSQTPIRDGVAVVECVGANEFDHLAAKVLELQGSPVELKEPPTDLGLRSDTKPNGWESPAPNGHKLFEFQKTGVNFVAQRGGRCIIGDEMGVGKTAQAIAAAQALGTHKVLVIAPASARYVWDQEIRGWLGEAAHIQHARSRSDNLATQNPDGNGYEWVVTSYDQIVIGAEHWKPENIAEYKEIMKWLFRNRLVEKYMVPADTEVPASPAIIDIPQAASNMEGAPKLTEVRLKKWHRVMTRLKGRLLKSLFEWHPDMIIVDEAHRSKNADAKRTQSVRNLSETVDHVLLLTGTPVRNNAWEAINLLRIIEPLDISDDHALREVKEMLKYFMIRRLKKEVMPELPPQRRQEWPVDVRVPGEYFDALALAFGARDKALLEKRSEKEARQAMRGGLAMARHFLGIAKIDVAALLAQQIVEQNERHCCVVFGWHKGVIDGITKRLVTNGLKVGVIRGDVPVAQRAEVVNQFQAGVLDVIVANHQAGGEAITLTRADSVLFVEHDWVPGVIQQAEARIHRVQQTADVCWTYHLLVSENSLPGPVNMDTMLFEVLQSKLKGINELLDETSELTTPGKMSGSVQNEVIERLLNGYKKIPLPTRRKPSSLATRIPPVGKPHIGTDSTEAILLRDVAVNKDGYGEYDDVCDDVGGYSNY